MFLAFSGPLGGPLEGLLGRLGALLGRLGALLGRLEAILKPSWGHLRAIAGPSWGYLGASKSAGPQGQSSEGNLGSEGSGAF